jgi:hypothetical protein
MFGRNSANIQDNEPVATQDNEPVAQEQKQKEQKQKAWRATVACTFDGRLVKEGEIVLADKMDNPHFEKAEE